MPLSKHFGGHGEKVMKDMRERYGEKAERIFYATENKMKDHLNNMKSSGMLKSKKKKPRTTY